MREFRSEKGLTKKLAPLWQVFTEPIFTDYYTPRAGQVFEALEKEADRIGYRGRTAKGLVRMIRKRHGGGYFTLYAHTSKVFVAAGELVNAGSVIATVGDTGSLLGNILHFEIRKDAEPVNPAPWMSSTQLR